MFITSRKLSMDLWPTKTTAKITYQVQNKKNLLAHFFCFFVCCFCCCYCCFFFQSLSIVAAPLILLRIIFTSNCPAYSDTSSCYLAWIPLCMCYITKLLTLIMYSSILICWSSLKIHTKTLHSFIVEVCVKKLLS